MNTNITVTVRRLSLNELIPGGVLSMPSAFVQSLVSNNLPEIWVATSNVTGEPLVQEGSKALILSAVSERGYKVSGIVGDWN